MKKWGVISGEKRTEKYGINIGACVWRQFTDPADLSGLSMDELNYAIDWLHNLLWWNIEAHSAITESHAGISEESRQSILSDENHMRELQSLLLKERQRRRDSAPLAMPPRNDSLLKRS